MIKKFLQQIPLFAGLADDDFEHIISHSQTRQIAAGEVLFDEGDPGTHAYVIQSGQLEIVKLSQDREVLLAVTETGAMIGEMALLEDQPRSATVRARGDTELIEISKVAIDHLLEHSHSATRAMFHTIMARLRSTQIVVRQSEKMAQLGTLTAGVAHELNNPASAVKRSAEQSESIVRQYARVTYELGRANLAPERFDELDALITKTVEQLRLAPDMSSLDRSDLEANLEDWMDDQGVDNAWELAPMLADMGLPLETLEDALAAFPELDAGVIAVIYARSVQQSEVLRGIAQGAGRISEIVKALKSYSYLDQAPQQDINIHEGLDDTLLILKHKMGAGIKVVREYDATLPEIPAYGSELNQVWTNLLDNAIDALDGTGQITIRTYMDGGDVLVDIEDNGTGIPEDIQGNIFDAFFTTKPPGKGTGLGLDISYRIVVVKHRGDIRLESEPGRTVFTVRLPCEAD